MSDIEKRNFATFYQKIKPILNNCENTEIINNFQQVMKDIGYLAPECVNKRWDRMFSFILSDIIPIESELKKTSNLPDDHWTQKFKKSWHAHVPHSTSLKP